jgi:acetyltransferase
MNWTLSDGTEVLLRPVRPEDEPLEYELLTSVSAETLKGRFFQNIKNITHEMLTRLCNIDYEREIAIAAEVKEGQKRKIIGIGQLSIEPDYETGEFSVIVHDDYQGKRLGFKLSDLLIGIAQEKGLERFFGYVLTSNKRMVNLCRRLGFTVEDMQDGLTKVELVLR